MPLPARADGRLSIPRAPHACGPVVLWPGERSSFPLTVMTVLVSLYHNNSSYSNVVDASMRLSRWDRACVGPRTL